MRESVSKDEVMRMLDKEYIDYEVDSSGKIVMSSDAFEWAYKLFTSLWGEEDSWNGPGSPVWTKQGVGFEDHGYSPFYRMEFRESTSRKKRVNEGITVMKANAQGSDRWDGPSEWNTGNIPAVYWKEYWDLEFNENLEDNQFGEVIWDFSKMSSTDFKRFKNLVTKYHKNPSSLYDTDDQGINDAVYEVIKDVDSPEDIRIG